MTTNDIASSNFIKNIIDKDLEMNKNEGRVHTRFPPEPNGYLHIGHAKSIVLNSGLAREYNGKFNLRFDDTNPSKEEVEYVESIIEDVRWLGADWKDRLFYASDYFEQMYDYAIQLIKKGLAYVDDLTPDEIREYRGTLTEPGKDSPFRERSVEENLDLIQRMKEGEFAEGEKVLRAKIDMQSPNMNLRDPILYRIMRAKHHRTNEAWCIYPMYDYAHPISDAIEGITHSICTLEFEDHRPLYNWVVENIDIEHQPRQIEFARLNLTNTVLSKRKLRQLVEEGYVAGWDDPRMPTISGMRRRGYTPEAIRDFCNRIGVAKANSTVDMALLESCLRDDLGPRTARVMGVLHPLKVVIENYPEDGEEWFEASNHPKKPEMGKRQIPFTREIYIDRDDFRMDPPSKFYRLSPGKEVRLMNSYIIKCESVIKDEETGEILELRCTYDPDSRSGGKRSGRKVKGTLHWVSAKYGLQVEVRMYDRLLLDPEDENEDIAFTELLNPESLLTLTNSVVEPSLSNLKSYEPVQFMRKGYFTLDPKDSTKDQLVFNQIVSLRDTWAKIRKKNN